MSKGQAALLLSLRQHFYGPDQHDQAFAVLLLFVEVGSVCAQGRRVVRLKGGCPSVFARVGSELRALAAARRARRAGAWRVVRACGAAAGRWATLGSHTSFHQACLKVDERYGFLEAVDLQLEDRQHRKV